MKINVTAFAKKLSKKLESVYQDTTLCHQYAWWILETIIKQNQAHLIAQEYVEITPEQETTINEWMNRLIKDHIPIQYLFGSVPFNDVEILVEPPTLIPRPETEEWTLWLINQLNQLKNKNLTILDLATGSGCIGLALARHFAQATIYATDISQEALRLAEKNAAHNVIKNICFLTSDLFSTIPDGVTFDLIVSNPPYIAQKEWQQLDKTVTKWEDPHALLADDNGLAIIEQIINEAPQFIKPNTEMKEKNIPQLITEIGHTQGQAVLSLMKKIGYNNVHVHKDLENKDRFVTGRINHVAIAAT